MDDDHLLEAMVFAVQQYLDFDDDYDARIVNPYRTVVRRRWVVISIAAVQYCNDVCFRYFLRQHTLGVQLRRQIAAFRHAGYNQKAKLF